MPDLEQEKVQQEQPEKDSGAEVSEPVEGVSEKADDVSGKPEQVQTFTDEQVKAKISEAEKDWQSRKDKEFSELQKKIGDLEKEVDSTRLAQQEAKELESWGDTPEVKAFQEERRRIKADRESLAAEKAKIESLANQTNMTARMLKAKEIVATHPGMDINDLLKCQTPDEMDTIVGIFDRVRKTLEAEGKEPQKVDSSVPSADGADWRNLKGREAISFGIKNQAK